MRARTLTLLALLATASGVRAQAPADTSGDKPDKWLTGVSLGMPGYGREYEPMLVTFGANFTQVNPNRIGADIAIGTMPWVVAQGAVPLGFRGGVAYPLAPNPYLLILPSFGASGVGVISAGGGGGLIGFNGGLATVFHARGLGLRTGVTFHRFAQLRGTFWLFEVGFAGIGSDAS